MACAAPSDAGRLIVIAGCMFAGKTAHLIERLIAARTAGRRVHAFKHQLDRRYDLAQLATHDGHRFPATTVAAAPEIAPLVGEAEVIGIDEAQFFGRPLAALCEHLRDAGRTVIVAGLAHDTWGQPFPPLPKLIARADVCIPLRPPCQVCERPADFHQRVTPIIDGHLIGGPGDYEPRCAAHFTPPPLPAPTYE